MSKMDLDLENGEEPRITIEAQSNAITPQEPKKGQIEASSVTSRVISPIPMNPAEMARMLALGKEKFAAYEAMVNDLVAQAKKLIVSDQKTHNEAVELGLRAKKLGKEIDERKKGFTKYAREFDKGLTSFTKPFTDGCEQIETITKNKNRDYMSLRELERRKQEKILKEAHKEVQEKVNAEADAAGVERIQIQDPIVKQEEKIITRTEFGSAHLRATKDWKILNLSLVPREIMQRVIERQSEKEQRRLLNPVIEEEMKRNPEVEIEGIMIFDSTDMVYRT